ncbi:hypothetical protein ZOSMA_5G03060 [Zostera marina]|uniref:Uncharacterized protein n=1 Tax=Zostera marina TaxID=29655 RepID=A0A0K9NUY1_ZOSMR|nr:hypothetical protein ZOSMA_5G03060 [Zostera marina]
MFTLHVSPIYHPTTTLYNTTCPRVSIQALHLKPQFLVGRWGQQKRGSVPCCLGSDGSNRDENRGSNSGGNDSKTVLDAFFLGKAFAETLNERVESTVGEILSVVGQWQAEQQKQIADFQEEVVERAQRDKEKTAIEAMDESKPSSSSSDSTFSGITPSPIVKNSFDDPLIKMFDD